MYEITGQISEAKQLISRGLSKLARKNLTILKPVNTENLSTKITQYMVARFRVFLTQYQDQTRFNLRTADVPQKLKNARLANAGQTHILHHS